MLCIGYHIYTKHCFYRLLAVNNNRMQFPYLALYRLLDHVLSQQTVSIYNGRMQFQYLAIYHLLDIIYIHHALSQQTVSSCNILILHSKYGKTVLSGHSKIYKTRALKTNRSQRKVESIAEYSLGAFCNTFDLH